MVGINEAMEIFYMLLLLLNKKDIESQRPFLSGADCVQKKNTDMYNTRSAS